MAKDATFSQDFSTGAILDADNLDLAQAEAVAEFEGRADDLHADGFVGPTAWSASINGASLNFAEGSAYHRGKRYVAPAVYPFLGRAVGTYYVFIDNTIEGVNVATALPEASDGLPICSVDWDGSALSSLTDLRVIGTTGQGQLQLKKISGHFDVHLEVDEEQVYEVDHSADALYVGLMPMPFAYTEQTGVEVELLLHATDGRKTDYGRFLLRVKNVSCTSDYPSDNDNPSGYTIRVFYERTGLVG